MNYKIIEARIEFSGEKTKRVTVLIHAGRNDYRAIFATTKAPIGCFRIAENAKVNNTLLELVARLGEETVDRDEIFSFWAAARKRK